MLRKIFLFLTSLFIGAVLLVWIIRTVGWQEIERVFISFSGWKGAAILGLTVISTILALLRWMLILRSQGHKTPFFGTARIYLAGSAISFFAPMLIFGGELFRGLTVKEKYSVPAIKGVASVAIDKIIETTLYLLAIFFGSIYFLFRIGLPPKNLAIIFGATLFVFASATVFFYFKSFRKESIIKSFIKTFKLNSNGPESLLELEKEIYKFFKIGKKAMWQCLGLAFLRMLANLARTWILIFFLGKTIALLPAFSILGFFYLATLVPVPAALGFHEAIQSFSFGAMNFGPNIGVAFAFVTRGADLAMALLGILFLYKACLELIEAGILKKIKKLAKIVKH